MSPAELDPDLAFEARVMSAVSRAIEPYEKQIRDLRDDAARTARYAEEDRKRLALTLKEDNEAHAEEIAEKVVNRVMEGLGLDPKKPADFVLLMAFVRDLKSTFQDARKHGSFVVIGLIVTGIGGLLWTAFKGSLGK